MSLGTRGKWAVTLWRFSLKEEKKMVSVRCSKGRKICNLCSVPFTKYLYLFSSISIIVDVRQRRKGLNLHSVKAPSLGTCFPGEKSWGLTRGQLWDHTKGGPLAFEGWSDDSGTLFVYKKETK